MSKERPLELNLSRWNQVWLARPWQVRPVPGSGMIELHGVPGYLVPGDVAYLFNLATTLPPNGCYLEVGSWLGLSSIIVANGLLANLNLRATIYCVDTWRGSPEHQALSDVREDRLFDRFLKHIREAQVDGMIRPIRGESTAIAQSWDGPELDLVFIDGDHSAEACYQDIRSWRPHLRKGGRLLGHDAVPGGTVEQALRLYRAERGCPISICPMPHSHFIWEIHFDRLSIPANHRLLM